MDTHVSCTQIRQRGEPLMALLALAVAFVILAIIAAVLGAGGIAGMSMNIAKWLVIVFLVLAVLSYVF